MHCEGGQWDYLFFLIIILIINYPTTINGHGRLIEPPSRASAWRYGFDTPHNYNDHELYCGGFTRQWIKNGGKCGVCGDAWDMKRPRLHEYGGFYGQGVIVRRYGIGAIINIRVELTANHFGYFQFGVCPDYKTPTQDCIDKSLLKLIKPQEGVQHLGYRYYPKDGNRVYEIKYRLPKKTCEHCLLQWRYIAGNNWGNCPNGTGAVGCGPQEEFRACADIQISGKSTDQEMEIPTTINVSTLTPPIPTLKPTINTQDDQEESFNALSALIISFVSFLVVFLVFFLFFFHFYHIGREIKNWLKGNDNQQKPLPPPRNKKTVILNEMQNTKIII